MKRYIALLIVGLLLFVVLGSQIELPPDDVTVSATITDIKTRDRTDDGPISYKHTYYGTYTVNGKNFVDKELTSHYNSSAQPKLHVGDTLQVTVSPEESQDLTVEEVLWLLSLALVIFSIVKLAKGKKKANQN